MNMHHEFDKPSCHNRRCLHINDAESCANSCPNTIPTLPTAQKLDDETHGVWIPRMNLWAANTTSPLHLNVTPFRCSGHVSKACVTAMQCRASRSSRSSMTRSLSWADNRSMLLPAIVDTSRGMSVHLHWRLPPAIPDESQVDTANTSHTTHCKTDQHMLRFVSFLTSLAAPRS